MAVLQDVTELQRVMEELESTRNLKELLETILDNAYEGIVVVDDDARITVQPDLLQFPRGKKGRHAGT